MTDTALREALAELQAVLSGILSDGPVMDSLDAEGPWWTPPDATGIRLRDAIGAAHGATTKALATLASPDTGRDAGLDELRLVLDDVLSRMDVASYALNAEPIKSGVVASWRDTLRIAIGSSDTSCYRFFGSDGTLCAAHNGRFTSDTSNTCDRRLARLTESPATPDAER